MAVPIQYTQQFIPTDVGALSNMLDQRQGQYDAAYAAPGSFEDKFAQIEVAPENIEGKQAILGNFQNKIQKVVDRYGGDYGAASKDIVREISKEKQNQFYQLAPQFQQKAEEARKIKQQLGAHALVKKDMPNQFVDSKGNITSTDFNYDISDVRDLDPTISRFAKEKSTEKTSDINRTLSGGLREVGRQEGFRSQSEAEDWMYNDPEGQTFLNDIYTQMGAAPGQYDVLDRRVRDVALSNLVGERKTSITQDRLWKDPNTKAKANKEGSSTQARMLRSAPKSGIDVLSKERSRINLSKQGNHGVSLMTYGESSLNDRLSQTLDKNYTTKGRTWAFGHPSKSGDVSGNYGSKGKMNDSPELITDGSLSGYYKVWEIVGVNGSTPKTVDKIAASEDIAKDYNFNSLLTLDKKGSKDSSIGASMDDKNYGDPYESDGKWYVDVNIGTDDQMKYEVSSRSVKQITSGDGRVFFEEASRPEGIRAFGKDHGDPLIEFDEKGKWSNSNRTGNIANELYGSFIQKRSALGDPNVKSYKALWAYISNGIDVPDEYKDIRDAFVSELESEEIDREDQIKFQKTISSGAI